MTATHEIIYIDAPDLTPYRRKTYGTAERLLDELTIDGPWLTARYLANRLGADLELTRRTLHRMYARGQITKRTLPGYSNEYRLA